MNRLARGLVAAPAFLQMPTLIIWNASASVPLGLYAVRTAGALEIGALVVVAPPPALAEFLAGRGYTGPGVLLIKPVAALPGQAVCRNAGRVTIGGVATALARERDRLGRPLPTWEGCRTLAEGEVFLLNRDEPDSLDGRYFGPLSRAAVVGRAAPLWTREAHR
jgi:conjugative transfer signal peptidase TraF